MKIIPRELKPATVSVKYSRNWSQLAIVSQQMVMTIFESSYNFLSRRCCEAHSSTSNVSERRFHCTMETISTSSIHLHSPAPRSYSPIGHGALVPFAPLPCKQKIGVKKFRFKTVKLERHVDNFVNFGREFSRVPETMEKQDLKIRGQNFAGEIRWEICRQFS